MSVSHPYLERVRFQTALIGVAAVTDLTLVDASGLLLHLVVMVTHVMLQVGQLGKGALTVFKFAPVGFLTYIHTQLVWLVGCLVILVLLM